MNNELKKLVGGEEVCGFTIRPWGIKALAELTPVFEQVYIGMKRRGVSIKNFREKIDGLVFSIMPFAPQILSTSLGMTVEKVDEKITPDKIVPIITAIIRLNLDYLKNLSAPVMATVTAMAKEAIPGQSVSSSSTDTTKGG